MPESFAVRCPCPEVFLMLTDLAIKAGITSWHGGEDYYKKWFCCDSESCGGYGAQHGDVTENDIAGRPIISIEAAIAELQKPREKPLKIGTYKVTFHDDGSISVGCQRVDAATMDEIHKRRKRYEYKTGDVSDCLYRRLNGAVELWMGGDWENVTSSHSNFFQSSFKPITEAEARERFPAAFTEATQ